MVATKGGGESPPGKSPEPKAAQKPEDYVEWLGEVNAKLLELIGLYDPVDRTRGQVQGVIQSVDRLVGAITKG